MGVKCIHTSFIALGYYLLERVALFLKVNSAVVPESWSDMQQCDLYVWILTYHKTHMIDGVERALGSVNSNHDL